MPNKPKQKTFTNSSADVLNAIRNSASNDYKNYVPIATPNADSIREIGAIIMDSPQLQNTFLQSLINRIARVIITSKSYENPLSMFKKGIIEFGETIEEIFIELCKVQEYDPEVAETELYKREMPDVRSAFHIINYKKFYKNSVQDNELRQAFLSEDGVVDLVGKIVERLYTSANYDEWQVMKYMTARKILNGELYPKEVPVVNSDNMKEIVTIIKSVSNKLEFMSPLYNIAKVRTFTLKENQYLLVNSEFDAKMDVEVLATAFNMDKAEFIGHRVLVDSFGELDNDRLAELFENDPNYKALTKDETKALDAIPAILLDGDWHQIYDNLQMSTQLFNEQGLGWNYFYHVWKTFSVSPFANGVMFIPATPSITSVTVTPDTATVSAGSQIQFTANVVSSNFASKAVAWSVEGTGATINGSGVLTLTDEATGSITVTATSVFDATKSDTASVTVG